MATAIYFPFHTYAYAGPEDGVVSAGTASIQQGTLKTDIYQSSDRAIIDWRTFNVGTSEHVEFHQPSSSSTTLNRVHAATASQIDGRITANGNVIIVNPNGVFFGGGSKVDVNSLVVTTADVRNEDFIAGNDRFDIAGNPNAKIVNEGYITAKEAGLVGLVAPHVENKGIIQARLGKVQAASGDTFQLDLYGDGLISVSASGDLEKMLVRNSGQIISDGGVIELTAAEARASIDNLIVNEGSVQADSVNVHKGRILIGAPTGTVQNTGNISAKGTEILDGGDIEIKAAFVSVGGEISATGKNGGTIDVQAQTLSLAGTIEADGLNGLGGDIDIQSGKTWETSTSYLSVDGLAGGGSIYHMAGNQLMSSGHYSAQSTGGLGGSIDISAYSTKFLSASVDASGLTGGGSIRLGGEYQGGKDLPHDEIPNATYLVLDRPTRVRADATGAAGKGGNIILWSDTETVALSTITATPGLTSGDGGFVEISSGGKLNYDAIVQTGRGDRSGTVLLDPKNIIVSDFSFNSTALIMGYGYGGGNNTETLLENSDRFGSAVSLDGLRLAVGASGDDGIDNSRGQSGAVYLFTFADTSFSGGVLEGIMGVGYTGGKNVDLSTKLGGGDEFGYSLSLDGQKLAVGAWGDDAFDNGSSNSGKAYLFNFSDTEFSNGALIAELGRGYGFNVTTTTTNEAYGTGISLDGNRLAVSARSDNSNRGAAYLYTFDDDNFTNLTQQSMIGFGYTGGKNFNLTSLESSDYVGESISLDGNMLALGSRYDDGFGNTRTDSGTVYLFSFSDAAFSSPVLQGQIGYGYTGGKNLDLSQLDASDEFGIAVSLDANRLAVGTRLDDGYLSTASNAGSVYLFNFADTVFSTPTHVATIGYGYTDGKNVDMQGRGLGSSDSFGRSLSLQGDYLFIGAEGDDAALNNISDTGAVHMVRFSDSIFTNGTLDGTIGAGYTQGRSVHIPQLQDSDSDWGTAIALDGRKLAVSQTQDDGAGGNRINSGAVHLYSFADDNFNGAVLEAIIGDGYTGGKNVSQALRISESFGASLSLDGNRLAVGATGNTGINNNGTSFGAVYLYQFTDALFSNITHTSTIGFGYTGGKNYNLASYLNSYDSFGSGVALDGNRLLIGANSDDGLGNILTDSGAIYYFTFDDTDFTNPVLQGQIGRGYAGTKDFNLLSLDMNDRFGYSVAIEGQNIAVGALSDDGFGNSKADTGAVYLFSFSDLLFSAPTYEGIIGQGYTGGKNVNITLDNNDYVGSAVAFLGNDLLVGAMQDDGLANVTGDSGAVYRFNFTDAAFTGGTLAATYGRNFSGAADLDLRGYAGSGDRFGRGIATDGLNLIISSHNDDGTNNNYGDNGAVYLMQYTDGTYSTLNLKSVIGAGYGNPLLQKSIQVNQVVENDQLGYSVSLDGNRMALGAIGDDGFANNATDAGAVYLFSFSDDNYNGGKLEGIIGHGYTGGKNIDVSSTLGAGDLLGYSVSLDGNMLAVNARNDDGVLNVKSNSGAVYLFNFSDAAFTGGALRSIIGHNYTGGNNLSITLDNDDYFGMGVSLDANRLAIGVFGDDGLSNARSGSGAVHLYSFTNDNFDGGVLQTTIGHNYGTAATLDTNDNFGASVALDGNRLAIGATGDDGNANGMSASGAVYLYTFADANLFTGATLQAKIGQAYTGGKNLNIAADLDLNDQFGYSLDLDGNRLVVGAVNDDGFNNQQISLDAGGVHMFTFTDAAFSGAVKEGMIGFGYTGGKNIDLFSIVVNPIGDRYSSASLDGDRILMGSPYDDALHLGNSGAGMFIKFSDNAFSGGSLVGLAGNGYIPGMNIDNKLRNQTDTVGNAVSVNGNRIAIGVSNDDGFNDLSINSGAVYLYSTASDLNSITLEGIMGKGYTGGKNIDLYSYLDQNDSFGSSVSLNGNNLAVGAHGDDGLTNGAGDAGAIYLFSFADSTFNGGNLVSRIGSGYTGTKDLNLSTTIGGGDNYGSSVSLDGTRVAIGGRNDDGNSNSLSNSGSVLLVSYADASFNTPTLRLQIGSGYTGVGKLNHTALDASDSFGDAVSLNGNRLVVGAYLDDGFGNANADAGAAYMFTFTDSIFGGAALHGTIGSSYSGANDYDLALYTRDYFGSGVSLQNTVLAVGAYGDDGSGIDLLTTDTNQNQIGAVRIFTFADLSFGTPTLDSTIGLGYTGGKNISAPLSTNTSFSLGRSLSYDDGRLIAGTPQGRGFNGTYGGLGGVFVYRSSLSAPDAGFTFSNLGTGTVGITAASLATLLSTPQNVILQANNDIVISSAILVDNISGVGGTLTLQAGRNIILNALIDSDDGDVNLYANEKLSTGLLNNQRDAGAGGITMGASGIINAGTGNVYLRVDTGAGKTFLTPGDMVLGNIIANTITARNYAQSGDILLNGVLSASAATDTSILLIAGASLKNNYGAGALVTAGTGRWLAYTDHPSLDTLNGLTPDFTAYKCTYGGSCTITVPATDNGVLYQYGATILKIAVNTTTQFGDAAPSNAALQALYTYDGFIGADDASVLNVLPTATVSGISTGSNAGTIGTITLSGGSDDFYDYYLIDGIVTVNKRDITAAFNNATLTKSYGDLNPTINTADFTYTGLVNGNTNSSITADPLFGSVTQATGIGTYNVGVNFTSTNYNVTNAPIATLTIDKRNITAAWNAALSRIYGDTNPTVNTTNFTYTGLMNGDLGSIITASGDFTGITTASNAGNYNIAAGFAADNYNVTAPDTVLTINKRDITATVDNQSKIYGASNPLLTRDDIIWVNLANSEASSVIDDVTITMPTSTLTSNAGTTHDINLSVTDGNYNLASFTPGVLSILKRNVTSAWNAALTKIYGNANPLVDTDNFTYTGMVNADLNSAIAATANFGTTDNNTNVGTYSVGTSFSSTNYNVTNTPTTNLTISQRALSVVTDAKTKTYGDADSAFTGTITGLTANDAALITWGYAPTGYSGNAGSYVIAATATDSSSRLSNYSRTNNYDNLQVNKRNITAAANNQSRVYGASNPSLTHADIVWANLAGAETATVLDTVIISMPTATATSNAGTTHDINVALTDGNYNLTSFTPGVLSILKRNVTAAWNAALTKIYGNANPTVDTDNFTYTGLVNSDLNAAIAATADYGTVNAGTGIGTYSVGANFTSTNYIVTNTPTTNLTISKRDITAAWNAALNRIYGDTNPTANTNNFTYTGLVNGDLNAAVTASADYSSITPSTNAGTHNVGANFSASNYNISNAPVTTLTIAKRDITGVISDQSRAYGEANSLLNWSNVTWTNLANTEDGSVIDTLTFTMPTALSSSNAGTTHNIGLAFADNNYNLTTYTSGTLTIDQAALIIRANDVTRNAYKPNPVFTATYTGLKNGQTSSVVTGMAFTATGDELSDPGNYTITPAGGVSANYAITFVNGVLLVTNPAPLENIVIPSTVIKASENQSSYNNPPAIVPASIASGVWGAGTPTIFYNTALLDLYALDRMTYTQYGISDMGFGNISPEAGTQEE